MNEVLQQQKIKRLQEANKWLEMKFPELSHRELEIIQLLTYGFSHKEIALKLDIATTTVSTHVANVYKTLGFNKETELTRWYVMKCYGIKESAMFLDFILTGLYIFHKIAS